MSAARLGCYLEGGCPPGGSRHNPGARDRTRRPGRSRSTCPGRRAFAGESPQWGGGVAFYDHETPGHRRRGYLLTGASLADVAAQEMYRVPAPTTRSSRSRWTGPSGAPELACGIEPGPGRYETLVEVGMDDGACRC